ncbi:MAG: M81 family metallopeptidase, partial [Gemmatimonadetes bacterium]|nr:M81 family metallopeptidase [Gemmatimonadota bacterium]
EPAPLIYASACAGGAITKACYEQLRGEWFERLEQAWPVDGVLLPLHGSALAEGIDDPEGEMIQVARTLVGPDVPVIATLDLHAHITPAMVEHADALLAWETYPHSDQYQTGERAVALLMQMLRGECKPTMAMGKVPVVTSAIHGSTLGNDPFADLMRHTKSLEQQQGVLSTSLFLIHPYMDCVGMGSGGLVVTDNDPALAKSLAQDIARRYWDRRFDLEPVTLTPAAAIAKGLQVDGGPVILVETSDCCGGGAAGDSIATLSALVDSGTEVSSVVPVVDPEAAQTCYDAGVGKQLTLEIGHKLDPRWGSARRFTGTVESLSDGRFVYTGGQFEGHNEQMGKTAIFAVGAVRVMITSRATYDWADEQLRSVHLEPAQMKFIVAKNPMNFRLAYGELAREMIILDTPGPTPATLKHVEFKKLARPYFPADLDIPDLQPTILT